MWLDMGRGLQRIESPQKRSISYCYAAVIAGIKLMLFVLLLKFLLSSQVTLVVIV